MYFSHRGHMFEEGSHIHELSCGRTLALPSLSSSLVLLFHVRLTVVMVTFATTRANRRGPIATAIHTLLIFVVFSRLSFVQGHSTHHDSYRSLHRQRQGKALDSVRGLSPRADNETGVSSSLTAAQELVNMFLPAIAAATKLKLQNPRFNTWKFPPATGRVNDAYGRNTSLPVIGRRSTRQSDVPQGGNNSSAATSRDYMIAPELAEAARTVAESSPIAGAGGSYVAKAAELKARFWNQTTRSGGNGLHSRAASSFWMENVEMNGYAPYAGSDYVVCKCPISDGWEKAAIVLVDAVRMTF